MTLGTIPFPVILSAPSGTGKTTIARRLLELRPDVGYSVSATTRAPRAGEIEGVAYHFLTAEAFTAAVDAGEFAEYANVHGNRYGTLRREVLRVLQEGKHVVMDIDVQGAAQFAAVFPEAVQIFVLPPSGVALLERLRGRGTEDSTTVARRLRDALTELREVERYEYVVVNDDLERAVLDVSNIIDAEALRRSRSAELPKFIDSVASVLTAELHNLGEDALYARLHTQ
jgi:guanylate kinase